MNIILLSGGSGKRLWPLSNDIRSKQFIKMFRHGDGHESMLQRVCRQIRRADPDARVTVAASRSQVSAIHNQIGHDIGVSIEPCRRDTFPAMALATAYLYDVQGAALDEAVVVCPVDPYVDDSYFEKLKQLGERAAKGDANLVLMGITPTYPSEKYGYIIPQESAPLSKVRAFKEKPTKAAAMEYISKGALWNGGVFAYRIGYVLDIADKILGNSDYEGLFDRYGDLPKVSFDYAVVEGEPSVEVLRHDGEWKDVGTWNTLAESMSEPCLGKAGMSEGCENTHILNELDIPVFAMGVKNLVIAAGPDGILVSDKEESSHIKPYVDRIDQQVMFAEKSWGSYRVLDIGDNSLVVKVNLKPGSSMNYHSHDKRDEVWTVVSGTGQTVVDGMEQPIKVGDVITMEAGCKHTVIAETELQMVEVQLGRNISVTDKHKFELEI